MTQVLIPSAMRVVLLRDRKHSSAVFRFLISARQTVHHYKMLLLTRTTLPALICLGFSTSLAAQDIAPAPVVRVATDAAELQQVGTLPPTVNDSPLPDAPVPANASVPPVVQALSAEQKFRYASGNAFGWASIPSTAVGAAGGMALDFVPEFHQDLPGYGRYYWHFYVDQAVDSYMVNFVLASALHIDPRYQRLGEGGKMQRTNHALLSLVFAQTDRGQRTLNTPQLLGSGAAASLSSLYYPERERNASIVLQRWGGNLAGDALVKLAREFNPELSQLGRSLCDNLSFCSLLRSRRHKSDSWEANTP